MPPEERIAWIDNAKAVCLVLVVWGHLVAVDSRSLAFVYAFHIPLLFFLSGCLTKSQRLGLDFLPFLKWNLVTLVVPYAVFWTVSYAYWLASSPLRGDGESWTTPWLGLVWGTGALLKNDEPLWFFTCLVSTRLTFWFVSRLRPIGLAVVVVVGLALAAPAWPETLGVRLPWNLDGAAVALSFYGLGYACQSQARRLERITPTIRLTVSLAAIVVVATAAGFNGIADLNALHLGRLPWFYAGALAGIVGVVLAGTLVPRNRVAQAIAENAIVIFPLHLIACSLLTGAAVLVFHLDRSFKDNLPWTVGYTVYAVAACVAASVVLRRYAPWSVGVRRRVSTEPVGRNEARAAYQRTGTETLS